MSVKLPDKKFSIQIAGENALIIYFTDPDKEKASIGVKNTEQIIRQSMSGALSNDIIDLVPSYASLMVMFNLLTTDHHQVRIKLRRLLTTLDEILVSENQSKDSALITLPVYYAEESGPDLAGIAKRSQLSIAQVIDIHQAQEYQVYAIGFAPGFAYLGEVDMRIASPRLSTPRAQVPKGAVAIADRQTAVYPNTSPGGWNIIGLCPVNMFDANAEKIMPVKVGDKVKFTAISKAEFIALGGKFTDVEGYFK